MNLNSIWVLLILSSLLISFITIYIHLKSSKVLKDKLEKKELEYKHQAYETLLLDLIHQKFGYVIDINKILDTVVESLSSIIGYTAVSYIHITPAKMRFRFHMFEQTPQSYLEEVKSRLINDSLKDYASIKIQNYMEETVSGNLINDALVFEPKSFIDIPVLIDEDLVGVILVTSRYDNFYKEDDTNLARKSISRVFVEVARLKKLIDGEKTKLEVLVDSMDSGVILIGEDFSIIAINNTCVELLELKSKTDTTIFEIAASFTHVFPLDLALAEVLKEEKLKHYKDIAYNDKYFDVTILPINSTVTKKSVGIIINDRTDEHKFSQIKDDFISMVVHELRSPLTIIKGTADMLIKRGDDMLGNQKITLLQQVEDSSSRLIGLVNDLLDSAKIEAGKISIRKTQNDLNKTVLEVVNEYSQSAKDKQLFLSVDTDIQIGLFKFDADRVKQVLTNLIANALKFTKTGGVHVSSNLKNGFAEVSVADTGIGISESEKTELFNKYTQLQKTKTKENGTGLGLVIAKGIVEAHGGSIYVLDNMPVGAVFKFTLPVN